MVIINIDIEYSHDECYCLLWYWNDHAPYVMLMVYGMVGPLCVAGCSLIEQVCIIWASTGVPGSNCLDRRGDHIVFRPHTHIAQSSVCRLLSLIFVWNCVSLY